MKKIIVSLFVVLFVVALFVEQASAIPAFARRYKISCSTCHAPIPKLKPYGDEFAGNGFILKEEEKARDYVSAGDDMLWLNKEFPIGVRFDAYAMYDEDKKVETDLQSPWGLKLLSGGTLYKNIGYYFYFYMSERGEVAGVEDAYIHFDNVFNSPLDIMVGQFQTSDPLMKRELRMTFEDYIIYKQRFGSAQTNLAYDRGVMLVYGIEKTGTDLVTFIVNGNGKAEADHNTKKFDSDKFKNFGFRIAQGIGEHVSVGAYYYQGKELIAPDMYVSPTSSFIPTDAVETDITFWGPDFSIGMGPVEITGQYLKRIDDIPNFVWSANTGTFETDGIIAELIYSPKLDKSRYFITALYNNITSEMEGYDYETATLNYSYLIARNLKLMAEYTRDLHYDTNRLTFGFISGF